MINKANYYAVIPANVRYSDISNGAKLLFAEIACLCNYKGYCWATNAYFGKIYKVEERTASRWVSELEKEGFIEAKQEIKGKGNPRLIWLKVDKNVYPPTTKMSVKVDKNVYQNTNTNIKKERDIFNFNDEKETIKESDIEIKEINGETVAIAPKSYFENKKKNEREEESLQKDVDPVKIKGMMKKYRPDYMKK